jgi:Fur family transcriptional regulator, peroxide stress response regulator
MKNGAVVRQFNDRLAASGLRLTPQREQVYQVLLAHRDHPTAEQVFLRAKPKMPDISMATVYNCLDALVKCGLVRLVNVERSATRYCPNMREHFHFHCEGCGGIFDIDFDSGAQGSKIGIPRGFRVVRYEIAAHGQCPDCAGKRAK